MNILVIGLGSIATKHIAAINRLSGGKANIYALRSRRDAPGRDGVTSLYDAEEAEAIDFDFAIVASPTSHHAEALFMLSRRNIPIMIEKPVLDRPDCSGLVERLEHDRLTYVACNLRFLDALRFVKERVDTDTMPSPVNEINVYCGSSLPSWRPGADWRSCYSAIPELGGGVHLDLIHEIDYLCWIFGLPETSRAVCRSKSTLGIRAIDYANYCLVYPRFCASVILNYYRPGYKRTMEIVMGRDIWTVDIAANRITDADGVMVFESGQRIADTYLSQMEYFMNLTDRGARHSINGIALANDILKIVTDYELSE